MRKIVICEDSEIDREILKNALIQYFDEIGDEVRLIEYTSVEAMVADVEEGYAESSVELLFLDIYMDGINGMQAAHRLRKYGSRVPIVFLTASPDYAIESYDVQASGYLLKPFDESKLRKILSNILKTEYKRRIALKVGRQFRYLYTDEITYVESNGHIVTAYMRDGTEVATNGKLNEIEKMIDEKRYLRCNQSYLVNMDYIKDVGDSCFIMQSGETIPIRVRGRKDVLDAYNEYFNKHF